jgi:rubrerythrin
MPLTSFGAVLGFAEAMEQEDAAFYTKLAACAGADVKTVYEKLAAESAKNAKMLARTRRENVTEMILEPITGLTRDAFAADPCDPAAAEAETGRASARELETRAQDFYSTAAGRLSALPEVARVLKRMAKKRAARLAAL